MSELTNHALAEEAKKLFIPNYKPAELVIERGDGCWVVDVEGRRYLDLVSGIAVSALGHAHPKLTEAIRTQVGKVIHTSNLYLNLPSIDLARRLVEASFGERVFFCNSGAEANEAQIKLARRCAWDRGEKQRNVIVSFDQSFHGRTLGALTATAQPKYHEGFGPLPLGFKYLRYGDVEGLERGVDETTAAILVEPIQGEGGVRMPSAGFLAACRRIAHARGALLCFDEVQVGVGRTGRMFAHQHEGVVPDSMSLAKGIGGGLPLGAIVTTEALGSHLGYGTHATTFGGNPVACAAGCVVFDVLGEPGFLEHVVEIGRVLEDGLRAIGEKTHAFQEIRGRGLLIGAVLRDRIGFDAKAIVETCRKEGVLAHVAGADVLRLAPPLTLSRAEAETGLAAIERALRSLVGGPVDRG
jgi:acetylornithine/N-succinyldiaminopimelate aminotransferase